MIVAPPVRITLQKTTLTLPNNVSKVHPLYPKLRLIGWLSCARETLQSQGITCEALNIIIDSWRVSTQKQYKTSVSAWLEYCKKQRISIIALSLPQLLDFLTIQSQKLGYSALGTTRSALTSFITTDGYKAGEHPLISRFMAGVQDMRKLGTHRLCSINLKDTQISRT